MSDKPMTNAQWAMQVAYLASEAGHWAGDILTLPEDREKPVAMWQIENFLRKFRGRLDRIEDWAKEGREELEKNTAPSPEKQTQSIP